MEVDYKQNKALIQYANLMISKIQEVRASDWEKPWFTQNIPPQSLTGRKYEGMNYIILSMVTEVKKFKYPIFITQSQIKELGLKINKGEKGTYINFYKLYIRDGEGREIKYKDYLKLSTEEKGKCRIKEILRYYNVFNLEQTNYPELYEAKWKSLDKKFAHITVPTTDYCQPILDKMIKEQEWICPIQLKEQDDAFYSPSKDRITLPLKEQFPDSRDFYYTALHEMAHSTGHPERLKREFAHFGEEIYAREELVAELTSAYTGNRLNISSLPRKENAQYLKGWLEAAENEPNFIYSVLKDVSKANTFIEMNMHALENDCTTQQTIDIQSFNKSKEGIIYANGKLSDGNGFNSMIFKKHEQYCYVIGSIENRDIKIVTLKENELEKLKDYLNQTVSVDVSTQSRALKIHDGKVIICIGNKEYDASGILQQLNKEQIKVSDISTEQWKDLLKGKNIGLKNDGSTAFCLSKGISSYSVRMVSTIKKLNNVADTSMDM